MENLKLTSLEEAIMLAALHRPRYGQDIVEVVSAASQGGFQIGCGALYPALNRLAKRGLIQKKRWAKTWMYAMDIVVAIIKQLRKGVSFFKQLRKLESRLRAGIRYLQQLAYLRLSVRI